MAIRAPDGANKSCKGVFSGVETRDSPSRERWSDSQESVATMSYLAESDQNRSLNLSTICFGKCPIQKNVLFCTEICTLASFHRSSLWHVSIWDIDRG